jgi:restriction system protein
MSSKQMMSFKDAATHILKAANEPLSAQEIVERAMQQGILSTEGKTPAATMGAQLYVDINKNKKSKFKKVGRGKFTLKEQTDSATTPLLVIENQNALVKEALMKKLYEMDPYQFEFLIADLLKDIGYENIEVTRSSGDKGIDVSATLTMGGITDVKTIIQAKRFKKGNNVPGRIIAQLRGSAEVDQRGMVITTSDFTRDAVSEAKASNKMPVSLINGEKLLSLMQKHRIGIKSRINYRILS